MAINRDRRQENYDRYQTERNRFASTVDAANERRERRRAAEAAARQEAALQAQKADEQARRDKQQQLYEQQTTAQRGFIASDLDAQNNAYRTKENRQQQQGVLKRDQLQNQYATARERQQALDQQFRDQRLFGYSTLENEQQFGHQMQRDSAQHGNTLQRDALQFGLDTKRENQQQQHTLQRDYMQGGIQAQRDLRLNEFDAQRDERQQGFTQQNMYLREAADITAKWQEQVQISRNAGLDFSEKQRKEMNDLDAAFRKNVLNNRDLDELTKQQAAVEHQRKLSSIIPEERVSTPEDEIGQQFRYDERMKSWLKRSRDSQGFADWEPIGGGGGEDAMMKQQQQQAEKQAERLRQAKYERDREFMKMVRERQLETDVDGKPVYADREAAIKAAMDDFAGMEANYREDGLPPLWAFQKEADEIRAKQPKKPVPVNPYMKPQPALPKDGGMAGSLQARSGDGSLQQPPARSQKPTATNIDEKIQQTAAKGDAEGNAALEVVKRVTANGPPKPGTPEFQYLMDAYRVLQKNGIKIDDLKKKPGRDIVPPHGGDFYAF